MFFFLIIATLSVMNALTAQEIVHGNRQQLENSNIDIWKFPYHVSVQYQGNHICSGSIVTAFHILTAAQCVSTNPADITVRSGTSWRSNGGSVSRVHWVIRHSRYHKNMFNISTNDVALLQLYRPLRFGPTRQPIRLLGDNMQVLAGSMAYITGWSKTANGQLTGKLEHSHIPVVNQNLCKILFILKGGLPEKEICAGFIGINVYKGEPGSPLVINGIQVGIASWSMYGYPAIYIEVAAYRDWIRKITRV